ncbi:MAG: glycosyltransferase family 2 protein [Chloroflexota bacterium]
MIRPGTHAITVVIIAYNEEANIAHCLRSLVGWAHAILVVDSLSTDATAAIASRLGATIHSHKFVNWAEQRNWALAALPIQTEWVLFVDADEQVHEGLKREIEANLASQSSAAAFGIAHDFIFMGRRLRHALESPAHTRLVRFGQVKWLCQGAREYCVVDGDTRILANRFWHEDHKGLSAWITKHDANATREAKYLLDRREQANSAPRMPTSGERRGRLWVRERLWGALPPVLRSIAYFVYRYVVKGGFLDGTEGFIFVALHAFWYHLLIDAKLLELKRTHRNDPIGHGA